MAELLNRSAFKKEVLERATAIGKRRLDKDGKYERGINRIPAELYAAANGVLKEYIDRALAVAHPTRSTLDVPMAKGEIAALGLGPRKRRRS